jgi:hypothetical protein
LIERRNYIPFLLLTSVRILMSLPETKINKDV